MHQKLFDFSQLEKIDKLYFGQHGSTDHAKENQQKKNNRLKKKSSKNVKV